jgi:hypothetical protein
MKGLLLILGVVALSLALRTLPWTFTRKLGALGFLAASFMLGYFASGKIWIGAVTVAMWFLFPWIELITRTRKMRLPVKRSLSRQSPPGSQRFPELNSITEEIEAEGFVYVKDSGWKWNDTNQFYRFFYHEEKRTHATICFTEQSFFSYACVSISVRHEDGRVFRTANLPFSSPMKSPPNIVQRRDLDSFSFQDFVQGHEIWLEAIGLATADFADQSPEDIIAQVESESGNQIHHNVDSGIIALCEKAETWRYSWRGLLYLYFQTLKDFVRWC